MRHVLEFDFEISDKNIDDLNKINKIRNCIAHANGNLSAMSENKAKEIRELSVIGLDFNSSKIDVSYEFLNSSMNCIENIIRDLMSFIENRYNLK